MPISQLGTAIRLERKWHRGQDGVDMAKVHRSPEGVGFLRTELATGLSLAQLALMTNDRKRASRNASHASLAYRTALNFRKRIALTPAETAEIDAKVFHLKTALRKFRASAAKKAPRRKRH
jgi:hypothetical protein